MEKRLGYALHKFWICMIPMDALARSFGYRLERSFDYWHIDPKCVFTFDFGYLRVRASFCRGYTFAS
jgi:hypothetical protein